MIPPNDQAACINGISVLPAARSTAAPSTLIITSTAPIPKPTITNPAVVTATEWATPAPTPIMAIAAPTNHRVAQIPRREPSHDTNADDAPKPATEPTVTPARTRPTAALPSPRSARS